MSIDYDLLEEQLHTTTGQGHSRAPWQVGTEDKDGYFDVRDTDYNVVAWRMTRKEAKLVALAPDMARELLRLRGGVEQLVESERDAAELMRKRANTNWRYDAERYIADAVDEMCDTLTDLLEGDTE